MFVVDHVVFHCLLLLRKGHIDIFWSRIYSFFAVVVVAIVVVDIFYILVVLYMLYIVSVVYILHQLFLSYVYMLPLDSFFLLPLKCFLNQTIFFPFQLFLEIIQCLVPILPA